MKHFIILTTLATTALLLLSSITTTAGDDDITVNNVYGEPLVAGGEYYIFPYENKPIGGGFTWKKQRKSLSICPEASVNQITENLEYGEPAAIYPAKRRSNNKITVSSDVNIMFPEVSPPSGLPILCDSLSNIWRVESGKKVMLGGKKGKKDSNSVFKIQELKTGGYGIYFCNNGRKSSSCQALSVDSTTDDRPLVVNGTAKPIPVVFEPEEFFLRKREPTRFAT